MSDYNGWKNHQTWLVKTMINPKSMADLLTLQEELEEYYSEAPWFVQKFIHISDIDWDELRASLQNGEKS